MTILELQKHLELISGSAFPLQTPSAFKVPILAFFGGFSSSAQLLVAGEDHARRLRDKCVLPERGGLCPGRGAS